MPDAAEKARALLEKNTGSAIERAQVYATLAVAEAVDRLRCALDSQYEEVTTFGESEPRYVRVEP